MAAALDLITLADFKVYRTLPGTAKDAALASVISAASRAIEDALGRRLVYRAPPTGEAALLSGSTWAAGTPAAANPVAGYRTLIVTFTTATAGTIQVTCGGVTETLDAADGLVQHGVKFFPPGTPTFTIAGTPAGGGTVTVTTSAGYLEYHTPDESARSLFTLEWPIANIQELNHDPGRVYGSSTALVAGTDYRLSTGGNGAPGTLTRLTGGTWEMAWFGWTRAVKLIYSGGYRRASVPEQIKDVCRRYASMLFDEVEKGRIEVASGSSVLGSWTKFGCASLSRGMLAQLAAHRRARFGADTGERDFDEEAA
jgi:hypothetical protein